MTNSEKLFQDAIKISAEVVKDINEDDYDLEDKDIIDLNDKVSNIQCELLELPMDFEVKNRKEYCKKLLGKDYFSDNRCWDYLSDVVYEIENDIGSMIINESIIERSEENKKSLKESKEFFVGDKTAKGFEVCMIEDGKKYYLSKLAKNIEDSSWSSDHTYAKHWKDKSRAEEIVNMLNSELKESKKSIKERSEENEIIVSELQDTVEYFCGLFEEKGELKGNALKDLQNAIERLEVFNAIGSIYQWGVEVLNKCGIKYKGLKESKKSSRKSLNESKNIKKSLEIIRRKIIELVNDETIQDEFNEIFDLGGSSFDTVDDWFEITVHNVLHDVLKDWTIVRIPF